MIDPRARAELEAAIDADLETGVRAKAYHGDPDSEPSKTFTEGTLVERVAGVARHRIGCTGDVCVCTFPGDDGLTVAEVDRLALREILRRGDEARFWALHSAYCRPRTDQPKKAGVGPCPSGSCIVHWEAERKIPAASGHRRCHPCQGFYDKTNHDYPPLVLKEYREAVRLLMAASSVTSKKGRAKAQQTAERKAWDHPRVIRAWQATGWNGAAGVRYPERRSA